MSPIHWQPLLNTVNRFIDANYRWFVVAELLLIGWFGWAFLLRIEYQHIQNSGILEYRNRVEQRQNRLQTLKQMQELDNEMATLQQERLQQIEMVLPTGIDPVDVMNRMQEFAAAAGVTLLSIDVVQASSTDSTATSVGAESTELTVSSFANEGVHTAIVSINIETASGSYADLKNFLGTLESFTPILNLRNLTYAPQTTSFALQLETYYIDSTP